MRLNVPMALTLLACVPLAPSDAAEQQNDLILLTMPDGSQITVEMATGMRYPDAVKALEGLRWDDTQEPLLAGYRSPATSDYVPADRPHPLELYHHGLSGAAERYIRRLALERLIEQYRDVVEDKLAPDGGKEFIAEYARLQSLYAEQRMRIIREGLTRDQFIQAMTQTFPESTWSEATWNKVYDGVPKRRVPLIVSTRALPYRVDGEPAPWLWTEVFETRIVPAIVKHEMQANWEEYLAATRAKMGTWRCFVARKVQPGTQQVLAAALETFADKDGGVALKGLGEFQKRLIRYGSPVRIEVVGLDLESIRRLAGAEAFPHPGVVLAVRSKANDDETHDVLVTFQAQPDTGNAVFGPGPSEWVMSHVHQEIVWPVLVEVMDGVTVSEKIQLRPLERILWSLGRGSIHEHPVGVKIEVGNR